MAVLGVGGVFVKSADPEASKAWYRDVLGMTVNEYGGFDFLHEAAAKRFGDGARTVFARFAQDTDYFAPSQHGFMINLIVEDLAAAIDRIKAAGVALEGEPQSFEYGDFAWVMDPDGVKVELWQPATPPEG